LVKEIYQGTVQSMLSAQSHHLHKIKHNIVKSSFSQHNQKKKNEPWYHATSSPDVKRIRN
jgi:hypothetical protein